MRTLISNGTIVTADGSYTADVLVDGETISQIGLNLREGVTADETIDATGKYVIPGGIDVHTHMELPFGGTFAKDTFETGTRAAAFGGTTSIVDFAVQSRGKSLREGLDAWHAKAEGNAVTDYGFHMIMSDVNDDTLAEMDALVAEGVPDFKLFTAYPGVFYSDDGAIFRAMQRTAKNGGLIMMHAENGMAIDVVAADRSPPARPIRSGTASRATRSSRARRRTGSSGSPRPRRCRCTSSTSPRARRSTRSATPATAARRPSRRRARSTCSCRSTTWATGSRAPSTCARRRCGRGTTRRSCGRASSRTTCRSSSTDHCPFDFHGPEGARAGDFRKIPNGLPGVEDRLDLLHDGGVVGREDHEGALGRDRLDRAGQAVRDVPEEGRHRGRLGRRPGRLRPGPQAHDLGEDAPHGRRLLVLRGPAVQGGSTSC